jgi:hypothetical protein
MARPMLTSSLHRFLAIAVLPAAAACSGEAHHDVAPEQTNEADPLVSLTAPLTEAPITPLPSLGLSGHPASAAATAVAPTDIHGSELSSGADLAAAPGTDRTAWLAAVTGVAHTAQPQFNSDMKQALEAAYADEAVPDAATLHGVLGSIPGVSVDAAVDRFEGYTPVRQRWMKSQYVPGTTLLGAEQLESYPDPTLVGENRDRGARLYCAAREAQRRQSATGHTSLGEHSLASVHVFGSTIDLLVVEPTAVLGAPKKFVGGGANDGAQAFEIPMMMGTKITPIRGIGGLGSLPEVRSPLSLVTGESEIVTPTDERNISTGSRFLCRPPALGGGCRYMGSSRFGASRTYQTVTHGDAVVSGEQHAKVDLPAITLFSVGPLDAKLKFGVDFDVGRLSVSNERLLSGAFGGTARTGDQQTYLGKSFDTNPWHIASTGFVDTTYDILDLTPSGPNWLGHTDPFLARVLQDDDHTLSKQTALKLTGTLIAEASIGVLSASLNGYLTVTGGVSHHVRDEVAFVGNQMIESELVVYPSYDAAMTAGAYVHLSLDLGFWSITKDITVINDTTLTSTTSTPDEGDRMRIGVGAQGGNGTTQPGTSFHLPNDAHQPSFPASVDACLADNTPTPPVPPPCGATPPTGTAPRAELCMVERPLKVPFPANVCSNIDGYVAGLGLGAAQATCIVSSLKWVCGPTSTQYVGVVSHVMHFPGTDVSKLSDIGAECSAAGIDPHTILDVEACDATGRPFGGNNPSGWVEPGSTGTGTCH